MKAFKFRAIATLAGTAGAFLGIHAPARATGTSAGTRIENTASATYTLPSGGSGTLTSNTTSVIVDELLNVAVTSVDGGDIVVQPGSAGQTLRFTVANTGNGSEAFLLSARNSLSADDFDPSAFAIYLDSNGNGIFDVGVDQAYISGAGNPTIAADGSITVFIVSTIGSDVSNAQRAGLDLVATATTGTGAPGTTFANAGDGGGAAVVGSTGATSFDDGYYKVAATSVKFTKSQQITDPFGGPTTVPGSTITYTLRATIEGSGTLKNLAIADPIPVGTSYKANSLTLEGTPLSDSTDGDQGEFAGSAIAVRLGDLAAGQIRTVTFQVTVNN